MRQHRNNAVLGGFGILAVALAASSLAYACTTFRGTMTVSGNGAGNVAQTVIGKNGQSFSAMAWCGGTPTWGSVKVNGLGLNAATITISTDASTTDCVTAPATKNKLRAGTYDVGYLPTEMDAEPPITQVHNCHFDPNPQDNGSPTRPIDIGDFTVGTGGVGAAQSFTYNPLVGRHNICVFSQTTEDANAINIDTVLV